MESPGNPQDQYYQNKFDLGELIDKKIHSEDHYNYLQSVDYKYNIRGWLTEINDVSDLGDDNDAFGLKLLYNEEISGLNNNGLFNGNISSGIWSDAMDQSLQNAYIDDDLNRLRD